MPKQIYPKCMDRRRNRALTADGFIIPCCWIDVYELRDHSIYKEFFDPSLHIDNFENVEDIEDSPIWNKLEVMIEYGHDDLIRCHQVCCTPNEKDTPFRDKIRLVEV